MLNSVRVMFTQGGEMTNGCVVGPDPSTSVKGPEGSAVSLGNSMQCPLELASVLVKEHVELVVLAMPAMAAGISLNSIIARCVAGTVCDFLTGGARRRRLPRRARVGRVVGVAARDRSTS